MLRSGFSRVTWVGAARALLSYRAAIAVALLLALLVTAGPARSDPVTFTVNSTDDGGDAALNGTCDSDALAQGDQCTLRAAIQEANHTSDADTINFNIGGAVGVKTISVGSSPTAAGQPLPPITQPVTINGYSQSGATANTFVGVRAGTNANLLIELNGASTGPSDSGLVINTEDVVVKGLVINRFGHGISISGSGAKDNRVEGNFIGSDPTGTTALGNGEGVSLFGDAGANFIGGQVAAAHNLISGNFRGISISSNTGNTIQGNLIGTNKAGTNNLGNATQGISIGSSNNIVGSAAGNNDAEANLIAFNGDRGILVASTGNRILNNSIHTNGELGIDLMGGNEDMNGVTKNDGRAKDRDTGANNLQNFPVISSATVEGTPPTRTTTIKGTLKSTPKKTFAIQVYYSPQNDPSGFGEGEWYFDRKDVTTNRKGRASFTFTTGDLGGMFVTATATSLVPDPNNPTALIPTDTSEFSAAKETISK